MKPRLLLVDGDTDLLEPLTRLLERREFDVTQTPDGEEAILIAQESPPDLVLVEWMIDGISGLEVCRRLRRCPTVASVPIIMLTNRSDEADRIRGLEAGADDYVTKPFSDGELIARLTAALRRSRPAFGSEQLELGDLVMDVAAWKVRRAGRLISLAPTEFRLLRCLLEQPGRVFPRERLLQAMRSQAGAVDPRTVDVHIGRLRAALNVNGGKDLIRTVRGAGYAIDHDG